MVGNDSGIAASTVGLMALPRAGLSFRPPQDWHLAPAVSLRWSVTRTGGLGPTVLDKNDGPLGDDGASWRADSLRRSDEVPRQPLDAYVSSRTWLDFMHTDENQVRYRSFDGWTYGSASGGVVLSSSPRLAFGTGR